MSGSIGFILRWWSGWTACVHPDLSSCSAWSQLPARLQATPSQLRSTREGVVLYSGAGIIPERVGVAKKIKMRNPQIRAIGNIFYPPEPVLFPRTVRRNRTVGNRGVDALRQFFMILPNQPKKEEACHVDVTQQAFSNGSEVQLSPDCGALTFWERIRLPGDIPDDWWPQTHRHASGRTSE